jgi:hypothetical protein
MLVNGQPLDHGLGLGLEGFRGTSALLHSAETEFDPLGELLAAIARDAFDQLFDPAVGPDAEADGGLGHPNAFQVLEMLVRFSGG